MLIRSNKRIHLSAWWLKHGIWKQVNESIDEDIINRLKNN